MTKQIKIIILYKFKNIFSYQFYLFLTYFINIMFHKREREREYCNSNFFPPNFYHTCFFLIYLKTVACVCCAWMC